MRGASLSHKPVPYSLRMQVFLDAIPWRWVGVSDMLTESDAFVFFCQEEGTVSLETSGITNSTTPSLPRRPDFSATPLKEPQIWPPLSFL